MNVSRLLAGIVAAGLLLTGCAAAPVAIPSPTPVAARTPTPTPTPEVPVASEVILSLDSLTVVDQDGTAMQSVPFLANSDEMVSLVTDLTGGATPVIQDVSPKGFFQYTWDGITVIAWPMSSFVLVSAADVGGLPVRTTDGIHVGSSRAEVLALAPLDGNYDSDGDGLSDLFGLEAQGGSSHESLTHPGQPGTDFVGIEVTGDSVTMVRAPASDYGDV